MPRERRGGELLEWEPATTTISPASWNRALRSFWGGCRCAPETACSRSRHRDQFNRGRARSERLDATFDEGDAEELPYSDEAFDVVASIYGAMFAPRPDRVARELVRVCRRGGTIGMANWTKKGFIGRMLQTIGRFVAPPGMPSPLLWGDETTVHERFGNTVANLSLTRSNYRFDYAFPPDGVVAFFRENYKPANRAFGTLPQAEQASLRETLVELWSSANQSGRSDRTIVDAEYLEVLATRV